MLPTWQAAGVAVESNVVAATISPQWPAHLADDVALLLIESFDRHLKITTFSGFKELPSSPQHNFWNGRSDGGNLHVFWKRATSGAEAAPVIENKSTDHIRAQIITFRGCATGGNPFNATAGRHNNIGVQSVWPTLTTTHADCLLVYLLGHGVDSVGALVTFDAPPAWAGATVEAAGHFRTPTTPNGFRYEVTTGGTTGGVEPVWPLVVGNQVNDNGVIWTCRAAPAGANLTERVDAGSNIGSGSGFAVATSQLAVAGSSNIMTAEHGSTRSGAILVALTAINTADENIPYIQSLGDAAERADAGSVNPAWPLHAANDIGILIVTSGGWPIATPAGWTQFANSPQNAGSSGSSNGIQLSVYWKRAASGAEAAPAVTFVADHIRAQILTVKGCPSTGNPEDVTGGNNTAAGATLAITIPSIVTTLPGTLVLGIIGTSHDSTNVDAFSTNNLPGITNAGLDNPVEWNESYSTIGSGSGSVIVKGRKLAAGATGDITGFFDGSNVHQGRFVVALKPSGNELDAQHGTFTLSGQAVALTKERVLLADHGTFSLVGQDVDFAINRQLVLDAEPGIFSLTGSNLEITKRFGEWSREHSVETDWTKQEPTPKE